MRQAAHTPFDRSPRKRAFLYPQKVCAECGGDPLYRFGGYEYNERCRCGAWAWRDREGVNS